MSGWLRRLGMRLQPLFDPERDEMARTQLELRLQQKELGLGIKRLEEAVSHQRHDAERWRDDFLRVQRDGQREVKQHLKAIRSRFAREGALKASLMRRTRRITERELQEEIVLSRVARMAASGRPVLVGPWTGEVGFELIYWAPFVRWFVKSFGIDRRRLTIVSRGGTRSWYGDLADAYVDAFDYLTPEEFVSGTAESLKQKRLTPLDLRLIRRIWQERSLHRPVILHPQLMYALFKGFLAREAGVHHVFTHSQHARINVPARTVLPGLPDDYVAVKFYFRPSFPETPENVAFVRSVLDGIAQHHKIVLLNPGVKVDEHHDYTDRRFYDLDSVGASVTPQNNLSIQTAVVGGARAFVGTYGGFCYLAPLCGVPTIAFYHDRQFFLHHRYMADVVFASLDAPALLMLPTDAVDVQRRAVLDLLAVPPHRR